MYNIYITMFDNFIIIIIKFILYITTKLKKFQIIWRYYISNTSVIDSKTKIAVMFFELNFGYNS